MSLSDKNLGKSLANVFAKTARQERPGGRGYLELAMEQLVPPLHNPRQRFEQRPLQELADSIREHGILQPIIVTRRSDGSYEVLSGERRYRAARLLGLTRVPVVVREQLDERTQDELRLVENVQREDLNAIELAQAYRTLIDHHGIDQEELARRVGKERSSIANTLRLLKLAPAVQEAVVQGRIGFAHARTLLGLEDPHAQQQLAQRIEQEGLSVRTVEQLVRQGVSEPAAAPARQARSGKPRAKAPHLRELEDNLARLFDAEVQVTERGGRGKLTIGFHSKGHFKAVVDQLTAACEAAKLTPAD